MGQPLFVLNNTDRRQILIVIVYSVIDLSIYRQQRQNMSSFAASIFSHYFFKHLSLSLFLSLSLSFSRAFFAHLLSLSLTHWLTDPYLHTNSLKNCLSLSLSHTQITHTQPADIRSHPVWPDWATFKRPCWQLFLKSSQICQLFWLFDKCQYFMQKCAEDAFWQLL